MNAFIINVYDSLYTDPCSAGSVITIEENADSANRQITHITMFLGLYSRHDLDPDTHVN